MSLYDRDRGDEFRRNLAAAREPVIALARDLMRAAFVDSSPGENSFALSKISKTPDFNPAPLYVNQAIAILGHSELRQRLIDALQKMQGRR